MNRVWVDEQMAALDKEAQKQRWHEKFNPIPALAARSFLRSRGESPRIIPCERELVVSAARNLSATSVMAEETPPETMVSIELRNDELAHFISYVRHLDKTYRECAAAFEEQKEKHAEVVGDLNRRRREEIEDHWKIVDKYRQEADAYKQRIGELETSERQAREEAAKDRGQKHYRAATAGVGGAGQRPGEAVLGGEFLEDYARHLSLPEAAGSPGDTRTKGLVERALRELRRQFVREPDILKARSIIVTPERE